MTIGHLLRTLPVGVGERCRLRPRDGDDDECRLVAADQTGRARAADETARLLGGFRMDALAQSIDVSTCAVLDVDSTFVASLGVPDLVDRLLAIEVTPGRIRLLDGTRAATVPDYDEIVCARSDDAPSRLRHGALADALLRGYTAVVNDVAPLLPPELNRLFHQMGRAVCTQPQTNVYISERDAPGFGLHWDDHDVIVIQGCGRKMWEVFFPSALSPTKDRVGRDVHGERVLHTILEPGMALYIPRGWPHRVGGLSGSLSAHFTVGLSRLRFTDVTARWASSAASHGGDQIVDIDKPGLGMGRRWTVEDLEHEIGSWRRMFDQVPEGGMSLWVEVFESDLPAVGISLPSVGGAVLIDHPSQEDEVVLGIAAKNAAVHRSVVPGLVELFAGERVAFDTWADSMPGLSRSDSAALLRRLAALDVVAVHAA